MKHIIKKIGIIALAAVIVFSMAACDIDTLLGGGGGDGGGSGGGSLAGTTWKNVVTEYGISVDTYIYFNSSSRYSVRATMMGFDTGEIDGGTYTFNGSTGTFISDYGQGGTFTVSGNRLTEYPDSGGSTEYIKQ